MNEIESVRNRIKLDLSISFPTSSTHLVAQSRNPYNYQWRYANICDPFTMCNTDPSQSRNITQYRDIDVGGCDNITDIGLTAYADSCCNVSDAVDISVLGNVAAIRKIDIG